jgi:alpha-beta hydrolase superfamily lysophospholipase
MNILAFFHAYTFTHFSTPNKIKTASPDKLNLLTKVKTIFLGISNPRPENTIYPTQKYQTITLQSNKKIEIWTINTPHPKGTVILFHGYGASKSNLLEKSNILLSHDYNTVLVDFMGSGGSEGNQTTIGYKEADEVKTVFEYIKTRGDKNIYLFGTSMGAVAILKAIHDYNLRPSGIILECPFGSLYQTAVARFKTMHAPYLPMAGLLVFWGGIQNNFWAFAHQPTEYARNVTVPALLLYGEQDKNVSRSEIDNIYANLAGDKYLQTFELAGHQDYLVKYKIQWTNSVNLFLAKYKPESSSI